MQTKKFKLGNGRKVELTETHMTSSENKGDSMKNQFQVEAGIDSTGRWIVEIRETVSGLGAAAYGRTRAEAVKRAFESLWFLGS